MLRLNLNLPGDLSVILCYNRLISLSLSRKFTAFVNSPFNFVSLVGIKLSMQNSMQDKAVVQFYAAVSLLLFPPRRGESFIYPQRMAECYACVGTVTTVMPARILWSLVDLIASPSALIIRK